MRTAAARPRCMHTCRARLVAVEGVQGGRWLALGQHVAEALRWLSEVSMPVVALRDPIVVRRALDACARTIDGRLAAATTVRRKRAVLYNALGHAVELDLLDSNPIDKVQWRAPEVAVTVDRRVVANPEQVRALLLASSIGAVEIHAVCRFRRNSCSCSASTSSDSAQLRTAGYSQRDRRPVTVQGVHRSLAQGASQGAHAGSGGFAAGPPAVRPATCCDLAVAQRGRPGHGGRSPCGARGSGHVVRLRQLR
jgi:hypothetical protein